MQPQRHQPKPGIAWNYKIIASVTLGICRDKVSLYSTYKACVSVWPTAFNEFLSTIAMLSVVAW